MSKQELGPNQEKWLQALESGDFEQGFELLTRVIEGTQRHCCLGVGCKVFGIDGVVCEHEDDELGDVTALRYGKNIDGDKIAPYELQEILRLKSINGGIDELRLRNCDCLTAANDVGVSFSEIAAFCREHPEAVFREPR